MEFLVAAACLIGGLFLAGFIFYAVFWVIGMVAAVVMSPFIWLWLRRKRRAQAI